ncbi:hypothetical protein OS493_039218 [Desmophyllum pertusum]|uniref:Uncharacterized protein n=1 Tax=Desmophyllum pertusum TaxID=174260 RepID=A0A9W9ZWG4_9CNID|nr:hypothetical protein OS493_039218 [Desmophyllum pertusum]
MKTSIIYICFILTSLGISSTSGNTIKGVNIVDDGRVSFYKSIVIDEDVTERNSIIELNITSINMMITLKLDSTNSMTSVTTAFLHGKDAGSKNKPAFKPYQDKASPVKSGYNIHSNQSIPNMELTKNNISSWVDKTHKSFTDVMQTVRRWLWTGVEWPNDTNSDVFARRAVVITGLDPICQTKQCKLVSFNHVNFCLDNISSSQLQTDVFTGRQDNVVLNEVNEPSNRMNYTPVAMVREDEEHIASRGNKDGKRNKSHIAENNKNKLTFTRRDVSPKMIGAHLYPQCTSSSNMSLQILSNRSIPRMELTTNNISSWMDKVHNSFSDVMQTVIEWLWTGIEWPNDTNSDIFARRAVVITGLDPICQTNSSLNHTNFCLDIMSPSQLLTETDDSNIFTAGQNSVALKENELSNRITDTPVAMEDGKHGASRSYEAKASKILRNDVFVLKITPRIATARSPMRVNMDL